MPAQKYSYPWRTNNKFILLANGENFYPDILAEIDKANKSIYIIQYLVNSGNITGKIIDALVTAARRGVSIYIILDAYGSSELDITDRNKLLQAHISLVSFNPFNLQRIIKFLYRDHRKLIIIDDKLAYTGGAGFTDEFDTGQDPEHGWQDIMIKLQGELVADCYRLFADSWNRITAITLPPFLESHVPEYTGSGRVNVAYRGTQEVVRAITRHMQRAQKKIYIVTPYFVTTWKIRRQMRKASHRGIDVKLIVPGRHSDHPWINHISRHYYTRLLKNNIQIYEYQPNFIHTKLIICDDWVNTGSCNLDRWNMRFNKDANIEIRGEDIIRECNNYVEELITESNLIDYVQWQQRPLKEKITVWFWSKMALWIERLTQNVP